MKSKQDTQKKQGIRVIEGPLPFTDEDLKTLSISEYETYYRFFEITTITLNIISS